MRIDAVEFDFKGQRVIVSKEHLNKDGFRITWTERSIVSPEKPILKFKDLGNQRWLCHVDLPSFLVDEFESWLTDNLGNRFMFNKYYDIEGDKIKRMYELRGGDINDRMLLALRWG